MRHQKRFGALAPAGRFAFLLIFSILSLVSAPILPAQDNNTPTFHIESKLVNLFVNVTDQTGAIVGGLTKDDFQVAEDGRPQTIKVFERQSELPLSIVLAIDTSLSVRKDLSEEKRAANHFARDLIRPQDQMGLIQFATFVDQLVPFTNNVKRIDQGLGQLRPGEATALYDAIYLGSDSLAPKQGRKVLVVVSDGGDTVKGTSYDSALQQALRGEVMIYSLIDVPIAASAGRDIGGEHALITLSEQTGGKSFYVDEGGLDKAFAKVSEDLRTQYLIGYYPNKQVPGQSFHRVNVTVPRAAPGVYNIRCKAGYYSEPPPKPRRVPMD
ncbi:MAG TPA: VWA domain-containing protein [Terracidiphilus sp.]|jgi:Ca-activated chloride channel family protein|nr:VWA domain-containing protein [Terracidiphilus sp.]